MELADLDDHMNEDAGPEVTEERLKKALSVIEWLAAHCMDRGNPSDPIYRIAHVARSPGCFETHEDWEAQFQRLASELVE